MYIVRWHGRSFCTCCFYWQRIKKLFWPVIGQNRARWKNSAECWEKVGKVSETPCSCRRQRRQTPGNLTGLGQSGTNKQSPTTRQIHIHTHESGHTIQYMFQ